MKAPLLPLLLSLATPTLAGDLFVDVNQGSGANNGSSWADAFQGVLGLKDALAVAVAGDRIFVAQGTYLPSTSGVRTQSFGLITGVEIYGGCLGTETDPSERPPIGAAPTVLSADLSGNDHQGIITDNAYHVVRGFTVNATAVLDGFEVRGGYANNSSSSNDRGAGILCTGASPTVRNCTFIANQCTFGGGAGYINSASPTFTDCAFISNVGGSYGGAFDIATASNVRFVRCSFILNQAARAGAVESFSTTGTVLSDCLFRGNRSTGSGGGGALWIGSGGTAQLTNCTIADNRATTTGVGGLLNSGATVTVRNSIFWANQGSTGTTNSANQLSSGMSVQHTLVQGGYTGVGNLNADPLFVDLATGDLRLFGSSPAIDAGSNTALLPTSTSDLSGAARLTDLPQAPDTGVGTSPIVDLGAYELRTALGAPLDSCTPLPNSTGLPSLLDAVGSPFVADSMLTLSVTGLPQNQFALFVMSQGTAQIPVGAGLLCLGAPMIRFSANILNSGTSGTASLSPSFASLPQGAVFVPGSTWHFQLWHRQGSTSNFSSALTLTFE